MSIQIELSPASKRYLKKLKGLERPKVYAKIFKVMDREGSLTAGFISKNYLAGQRLRRITGTLAKSVVGAAETYRGLPAMRVGILTGPALHYAGILEFGTDDMNPASPYHTDKRGLPLTGRAPRFYLRDGVDIGIDNLTSKLEKLIVDMMEGKA